MLPTTWRRDLVNSKLRIECKHHVTTANHEGQMFSRKYVSPYLTLIGLLRVLHLRLRFGLPLWVPNVVKTWLLVAMWSRHVVREAVKKVSNMWYQSCGYATLKNVTNLMQEKSSPQQCGTDVCCKKMDCFSMFACISSPKTSPVGNSFSTTFFLHARHTAIREPLNQPM